VVLIATQTVLIHFVKRLGSFHLMYFTIRACAIAQEKDCPILRTANVTNFFVLLYFGLFIFAFMFDGN
jgi:hypothetical protein